MLDQVRDAIRVRMNDLADDVAGGAAEDYAKYQRLVGMIEGLATAERILLDIRDRVEKED